MTRGMNEREKKLNGKVGAEGGSGATLSSPRGSVTKVSGDNGTIGEKTAHETGHSTRKLGNSMSFPRYEKKQKEKP